MSVKATLRVRQLFFESNPMFTSFDQLQITRVRFEYEINDGSSHPTQSIDGFVGVNFVQADDVVLQQNTPYRARAIVYSPQHPGGIASEWVSFESDDVNTYYTIMYYIRNSVTNEIIEGAEFMLDPTGTPISKLSRPDGLVWFQRNAAGTHSFRVEKTGYHDFVGTVTLPPPSLPEDERIPVIRMVPV